MNIDIGGPETVDRMVGFASGCTATYVFMRNLVMRPAIKSCHQRIADIEKIVAFLTEQLKARDIRIHDLELALFNSGIPELRKAMQGVISEQRVEADKK